VLDRERSAASRIARLRIRVALCVIASGLGAAAATSTCQAEDLTARDVLDDAKLYFTAPIRWDTKDWLYFGGALIAIGAAHEYDGNVRRHFAIGDRAILNGQDKNSLRDALPSVGIVAGTWAFAALVGDSSGKVESYVMLEAAGFSVITAEAMKLASGRERPNETTRVDAWRTGGSSFPSIHATAAFAIGTVLAESGGEEYRWFRRVLGYGIASATAYVRLRDNVHWLSDTVAGAAVGIATAEFTMNRRQQRARRLDLSVQPLSGGGAQIAVTLTLH
jgi:membrane-associated phospholipid phosphatase